MRLTDECKALTGLCDDDIRNAQPLDHVLDDVSSTPNHGTLYNNIWKIYILHKIYKRFFSVTFSLFDRTHISRTIPPNFTKLFVHASHNRGSVFFWQRCDTLCTSGFLDDVMFSFNWPYGTGDAYSNRLTKGPHRTGSGV